MAKGIRRVHLLTALIVSLAVAPSFAVAKTAAPPDAKPGKEAAGARTPVKPLAVPKPAPVAGKPPAPQKGGSVKAAAPKPTAKPATAKTSPVKAAASKPSSVKPAPVKAAAKPLPAKSVPVKAAASKPDAKPVPVKATLPPEPPAQIVPASSEAAPPGCVANLVDADFQTLPVNALESVNRRLEGLGLTRAEADSSIRTLTERAGGSIAGGSVIVARYVDSCDPRRVQVISVSLALDGPVSYTWLRGSTAPATLVSEPVPAAPTLAVALPVPSAPAVEPAPAAPVAANDIPAAPAAANDIPAAPAAAKDIPAAANDIPVATVAANAIPATPVEASPVPVAATATAASLPVAPPGEESREAARLAAFSVGSFSTRLDAPSRPGFSEAPPAQTPLGFHLRVAGQVQDGDLGPALTAAGLPTPVVRQVLDSFAADGKMPLAQAEELSFDVLYRTGTDTSDEPVLTSAELSHGGQSRRLYYYVPEEGTAHLIDQEGKVRLAQGPDFIHPLPGYRMTSGFGWRMHPVLRARKFHKGVDWSAPRGTPVVAAGEGIVETVKFHRGYGKYVRIVHDDRTETIYAHLDQFAKGLKVGSAVRQGQVIGMVGRTGIASGNHLYFELIVDGRHIDPLRNVPVLVQDLMAEGKDKEDQQRFISFADTLLQQMPANATAAEAVVASRSTRAEPAPGDIP